MWTREALEQYIKNQIQESLNLEYKAANALSRTDSNKMKEITKDVSAMANSSGGILIYGIKEFDQNDRRHLPERIDPIVQTQYSKEWLEQVINNIRPRISGLVIHPVNIDTSSGYVVYVVEVPKSTTAHQATDWRYYKRYNFQAIPMEDYEIRDVMNRTTTPEVSIRFGLYRGAIGFEPPELTEYLGLRVIVKNEGVNVVNRFKIMLTLTNVGWSDDDDLHKEMVDHGADKDDFLKSSFYGRGNGSVDLRITYQPDYVLFPKEEMDVGKKIEWGYPFSPSYLDDDDNRWHESAERQHWAIEWKLYADNMPFKQGVMKVCDLPMEERA